MTPEEAQAKAQADCIEVFKGLFTPEELKRPSIKRHYDSAIDAMSVNIDQVTVDLAMKAAQEIKTTAHESRKKEETINKETIQKHISEIESDTTWDF